MLFSHLTFNNYPCVEKSQAKDLAVQHTETHGAAWGVMNWVVSGSGCVQGPELMYEIVAPVPLLTQHLNALRRPVVAQQVLLDVGHPVALQQHTLSCHRTVTDLWASPWCRGRAAPILRIKNTETPFGVQRLA